MFLLRKFADRNYNTYMTPVSPEIKPSDILPQQYPFLLIDTIIEFKPNEKIVVVKNITGDEWAFAQLPHTSNRFPEALHIEACAQTALAFYKVNYSKEGAKERIFLAGVRAEFFDDVCVGDQLRMELCAHRMMGDKGFAELESSVGDSKKAKIKIFYGIFR
jgi:3-hydroxyacyl-[acyl-carrier-protein] dehydratase